MSICARVLSAEVRYVDRPLATPLVLSSGTIRSAVEATAEVRVQVGSREACGRGSIYLSDFWAWPKPDIPRADCPGRLKAECDWIANELPELCGGSPAHPMELGLKLHDAAAERAQVEGAPPMLAVSMCASPFDAAIHDAVGQALSCSAFAFYDEGPALPNADAHLGGASAAAAIANLIQTPQSTLPAWWIVGKGDDLHSDLAGPIQEQGISRFKLKILGRDNDEDVERTIAVYRVAKELGAQSPELTVDSNEGNPDADSVLDYLRKLQEADAEAFAQLAYLEQPTDRDILAAPQDWRAVGALKPVLLDEGLTELALLPEALRQGWSGLALKTCKGHSFALLAAAWAAEHGLPMALQDLTNPGFSLIHAALFAAHIPMINGVELNSPQFTPAANEAWLPRLESLMQPRNGVHCVPSGPYVGLGTGL